eukprot:gnl/Chilomastix_cuspidata/5659.p1 GENE.gnl/Chilomastix_cuspidata/5659~~gnl/Chilomastix_cuspidata/5659.p1  ORF type:complete len:1095 (+),score=267.39 gnl/Chilomastix_cuspidata/5659:251-3535(+)
MENGCVDVFSHRSLRDALGICRLRDEGWFATTHTDLSVRFWQYEEAKRVVRLRKLIHVPTSVDTPSGGRCEAFAHFFPCADVLVVVFAVQGTRGGEAFDFTYGDRTVVAVFQSWSAPLRPAAVVDAQRRCVHAVASNGRDAFTITIALPLARACKPAVARLAVPSGQGVAALGGFNGKLAVLLGADETSALYTFNPHRRAWPKRPVRVAARRSALLSNEESLFLLTDSILQPFSYARRRLGPGRSARGVTGVAQGVGPVFFTPTGAILPGKSAEATLPHGAHVVGGGKTMHMTYGAGGRRVRSGFTTEGGAEATLLVRGAVAFVRPFASAPAGDAAHHAACLVRAVRRARSLVEKDGAKGPQALLRKWITNPGRLTSLVIACEFRDAANDLLRRHLMLIRAHELLADLERGDLVQIKRLARVDVALKYRPRAAAKAACRLAALRGALKEADSLLAPEGGCTRLLRKRLAAASRLPRNGLYPEWQVLFGDTKSDAVGPLIHAALEELASRNAISQISALPERIAPRIPSDARVGYHTVAPAHMRVETRPEFDTFFVVDSQSLTLFARCVQAQAQSLVVPQRCNASPLSGRRSILLVTNAIGVGAFIAANRSASPLIMPTMIFAFLAAVREVPRRFLAPFLAACSPVTCLVTSLGAHCGVRFLPPLFGLHGVTEASPSHVAACLVRLVRAVTQLLIPDGSPWPVQLAAALIHAEAASSPGVAATILVDAFSQLHPSDALLMTPLDRFLTRTRAASSTSLRLVVRRGKVLPKMLAVLATQKVLHPLHVEFKDESGVDAGGLTRTALSLCFDELMSQRTEFHRALLVHRTFPNGAAALVLPVGADGPPPALSALGRLLAVCLLEGVCAPAALGRGAGQLLFLPDRLPRKRFGARMQRLVNVPHVYRTDLARARLAQEVETHDDVAMAGLPDWEPRHARAWGARTERGLRSGRLFFRAAAALRAGFWEFLGSGREAMPDDAHVEVRRRLFADDSVQASEVQAILKTDTAECDTLKHLLTTALGQMNRELLASFLFAVSGSRSVTRGMSITVRARPDGFPSFHTCSFSVDIPQDVLDSLDLLNRFKIALKASEQSGFTIA